MGGASLLILSHSLSKLISSVYPEFKANSEVDIWTNETLGKYFVEYLKKQKSINEISFVYRQIRDLNLKEAMPLTRLLMEAFPQYKWIPSFSAVGKRAQYVLKESLNALFSGEKSVLLEEYRHPDIENLELDYFFPQYNLAIEYQVESVLYCCC